MIKVLQVFGEPISRGGQETFVMNAYRNIDRSKIQFDFYTPFYADNSSMIDEIKKMGGNVYSDNGSFTDTGNKKDFIINLKRFLKKNKYDIIHIHSGSIFSLAYGAKIARKSGAKKVIVHSHATGINNLKYKVIKRISEHVFIKYATDYIACSEIAAKWKFPKQIIKNKKYFIVKNGIDLEKFCFSEAIRNAYRKELNIENYKVICHVGRFTKEKNHQFLVDIMQELVKIDNSYRLMLIGDGINKKNIEKYVEECNLSDYVYFLGMRDDISELLQASDVFVFPSMFEGLGIVSIEAQATGLPTICSENIPDEANITNLFIRMNLSDGTKKWAKRICEIIEEKIPRKIYLQQLIDSGYSEKNVSSDLEKIYMEV